MEDLLPVETIFDIFSRLTVESVLQCRLVSKKWRTLIHHPYFADMHIRRRLLQFNDHNYNNHSNDAATKLGLLFLIGFEENDNQQLYYGEYDENEEQFFKTLTRINHPLVNNSYNMANSCNGLICFSLPQVYWIKDGVSIYSRFSQDPVYICNPITREYVLLPRFNTNIVSEMFFNGHLVCGFGYVPSTREYKVVRIYYYYDFYQPVDWVGCNKVYTQVYTLGSGNGWRTKEGHSSVVESNFLKSSWGVLANGALHWLGNKGNIVAFDLAEEELRMLPLPPCFVLGLHDYFQLQVLGGLLCFLHTKHGVCIDIWFFKEKKSETTYNTKNQEYQSWSWSREFSIAWEGQLTDEYDPFALTKNGEVLLWYNEKLSCYYPKTSTLKTLETDLVFCKAIPHMNSFVSLKALGEEDAKIIGSAEELLEPEKNCNLTRN